VFSEADGLPGLIIDLYNDTVVFQALTLGMDKFKTEIADSIDEVLKPKYIYEKSISPFRSWKAWKIFPDGGATKARASSRYSKESKVPGRYI